MNERRRLFFGAVGLVLITSLVTFGLTSYWFLTHARGGLALVPPQVPGAGQGSSTSRGLDTVRIAEVYNYLKREFVDAKSLDDEKLLEAAIDGMVKATGDEYTVYLNKAKYKELMQHFDASYSGIGVYVEDKVDGDVNYVTVVAPMKGTPGEKAGLSPGDRILEVDGKNVVGVTTTEAVKLIKGPKGTTVSLKVDRSGRKLTFSIVREDIAYPTLESKMLPDQIGYIRLYTFNEKIGERTKKAYDDLIRQGARGMILDLRQNPGGLLPEAVGVAQVFVPKGPVVHIVYPDGTKKTEESRSEGGKVPLVVLVDEYSASASEIVAGAVKDRKAGTLVGTRTFGKGSVQSVIDLKGGGGLKLTTAKYLTPNEVSINKVGVTPDVVVGMPKTDRKDQPPMDSPENSQLKKAMEVLKGKL